MTVTLSERFLSLLLGMAFGLLTFFIWGIAILIKGGPFAAKAAIGAMYFGLILSLALSLLVGLTGFIWGQERLARLLGILWGTDREFYKNLDEKLGSIVCHIPLWFVYLALGIVIAGAYGYLAALL